MINIGSTFIYLSISYQWLWLSLTLITSPRYVTKVGLLFTLKSALDYKREKFMFPKILEN